MSNRKGFLRRQNRVRRRVSLRAGGRPRLSVYRSGKNIYAQVIDDEKRVTVASASTVEKDISLKKTSTVEAAEKIGKLVAERAVKQGVKEVVFDRGGYLYHGRVKALAEAARAGGLSF